jgi:predicted DNA-binding protein YlxM (UPF0122 family)
MDENNVTPINPYRKLITDILERGYSMTDLAEALRVSRQAIYDLKKKEHIEYLNTRLYGELVELHNSVMEAAKRPKKKSQATKSPQVTS